MRLEFDLAVCRPCPKDGRCVGLTGKGDVASVTGLSAANGGEITKQVINGVDPTFTKYGQVEYVDAPLKGFDMGYIKMQAIGPGQCVRKAELNDFFECCGTTPMPAPDGQPISISRTDKPKIPVAANSFSGDPPALSPAAKPCSQAWPEPCALCPTTETCHLVDGVQIAKKNAKCTKWYNKWRRKKNKPAAITRKLKQKCKPDPAPPPAPPAPPPAPPENKGCRYSEAKERLMTADECKALADADGASFTNMHTGDGLCKFSTDHYTSELRYRLEADVGTAGMQCDTGDGVTRGCRCPEA